MTDNPLPNTSTPLWFNIISFLAICWNALGVMAFIGQMTLSPQALANMSTVEQELYLNTPAWATVAFAIAVICGTLGSFLLLMKKTLATPVLILSLLGVLVQMFHSFFISNSFEVYGPGGTIMPIMVVVIAAALVYLAKKSQRCAWLS